MHPFAALSDADFFSSRVQHIYLYDDITAASVGRLKTQLRAANQDRLATLPSQPSDDGVRTAPRPIVVHINSRGGSVYASLTMTSVFSESLLPVCVMVDGMSASAATLLSLLAPYRVLTPNSVCLVHEWWLEMGSQESEQPKRSDWAFRMEHLKRTDDRVERLMLSRTKMTKAELVELMSRDKLLDAAECMRLGFADRVLSFGDSVDRGNNSGNADAIRSAQSPDDARQLLRRPDANHLFLAAAEPPHPAARDPAAAAPAAPDPVDQASLAAVQAIDRVLQQDDGGASARPLIVHCSASGDGEEGPPSLYRHVFPLVARLRALPAPSIGVVDTVVDLYAFLPVLFCRKRVMYDNAQVLVHLLYEVQPAWMLQDIVHNTGVALEAVRAVLRARTKLPEDILRDLNRRRISLDAAQCLEYGLVDVVVPTLDPTPAPAARLLRLPKAAATRLPKAAATRKKKAVHPEHAYDATP